MDKRYKRLGKNTILVFLGKAGSKIIGLLMLPFYTHYLTTTDYGTSDLIATYATILVSVVSCCIADSIFIFPKEADKDGRTKYYTTGFVFALCGFALLAIIALFIDLFGGKGAFFDNVWWIYGLTLVSFLQNYTQQFSRSIDRMGVFSMAGVVHVACLALFAFAFLPIYGLPGYLGSMLISDLVTAIFTFFASGGHHYFNLKKLSSAHLNILLKYSFPLIPSSIMWWIVGGINRPIMESSLGLAAIGIYAVANKLPGILSMLFQIFNSAWSISMLEEFGKPDFNNYFNKTVRILFYLTALGTVVIIVGSKLIVRIFAAPEFFEAWRYVPALTIGVLLHHMSSLVGGVFAAEKKSKYFFYSSTWGAASSLILTIVGAKLFGLMGVCLAVVGSFLCIFIVRLYYAWKHINLFDIKYYTAMMLLLVFVSIVIVKSDTIVLTAGVTVASVAIMLIMNKEDNKRVLELVKSKINKNN